ncbi:hypothetical protein [Sphingomonas mesophila]|uniref:hypothetical protein n=1 Tax=Sphingomonas mesophila TaxID=2303576 RepID=UPI000E58C6E1|nr:hypothetical protein [Sphingomonas mesophila]
MDDPWFTYLRGRGRLQITPANAKGWIATILFGLALALPAFALPWMMERSPWLLAPYAVVLIAVVIGFVRWAKRRSQIIDLNELGRDYSEFQEWKKRNRR